MIESIVYDDDGTRREPDLAAAREATGTTWVRVRDPTDAELEAVRETYDLHPLAVEDVQREVRPKVEEFAGHTFVLLKDARLARGDTTFEEELTGSAVGLFLGPDWLVTLAIDEPEAVARTWSGVESADERLLSRGADFAASRVADRVVDEYFDVLDGIEDRIERIEDELTEATDRDTLAEVNDARRELLSLRKLLWPTREVLAVLSRGDPPEVAEATEKYYRDVYDHVVQLVDLVETYRDLASGARDIYLNTLSMSTNEVMKTLTVVATILLPLTFVVGVYGMNFGGSPYNMPELTWRFGYPAVMAGMLGVTLVLLWRFRRLEWL